MSEIMIKRRISFILIFCALILLPSLVSAGGPWVRDSAATGKPFRWAGNKIEWCSEKGGLGSASNATALGWVSSAFDKWVHAGLMDEKNSTISTVSFSTVHNCSADLDINGEGDNPNYEDYINSSYKKTIVIFDSDGSILEDMGIGTFVMGVTMPINWDEDDLILNNAYTIINGTYTFGGSNAGEFGSDENTVNEMVQATILHELGHMLNLDHTFANQELNGIIDAGDLSNANHLPTMFPLMKVTSQNVLARDDVVALSSIYPKTALANRFCRIEGEILKDDKGYQGAGIIVRSKTDPWSNAFAAVSGGWFPKDTDNGEYRIYGLMVGKTYVVNYLEIDDLTHNCSEEYMGSSIEPYCPARSGFGSGSITAEGGSVTEIKCETAGQVIKMDPVALTGGDEDEDESEKDGTADSTTKGFCSLVQGHGISFQVMAVYIIFFITILGAVISLKRHTRDRHRNKIR